MAAGYAPRRLLDHFYAADLPDDGVCEVDWVQGCALIARRAVYEQIGGLDEGYVMFSEELDWCRRAKEAGWRVAYVGTARITHYGGQSTAQVETRKHIHFQQSKLRYFRTYHGRTLALALRLFLLVLRAADRAPKAQRPRSDTSGAAPRAHPHRLAVIPRAGAGIERASTLHRQSSQEATMRIGQITGEYPPMRAAWARSPRNWRALRPRSATSYSSSPITAPPLPSPMARCRLRRTPIRGAGAHTAASAAGHRPKSWT